MRSFLRSGDFRICKFGTKYSNFCDPQSLVMRLFGSRFCPCCSALCVQISKQMGMVHWHAVGWFNVSWWTRVSVFDRVWWKKLGWRKETKCHVSLIHGTGQKERAIFTRSQTQQQKGDPQRTIVNENICNSSIQGIDSLSSSSIQPRAIDPTLENRGAARWKGWMARQLELSCFQVFL